MLCRLFQGRAAVDMAESTNLYPYLPILSFLEPELTLSFFSVKLAYLLDLVATR